MFVYKNVHSVQFLLFFSVSRKAWKIFLIEISMSVKGTMPNVSASLNTRKSYDSCSFNTKQLTLHYSAWINNLSLSSEMKLICRVEEFFI